MILYFCCMAIPCEMFQLLFPFLTSQVREGGGIKKKSNRSIFCSQVRVTDWEVPSPPLQAWEVPPEHQADESSGAGSDGGNDE